MKIKYFTLFKMLAAHSTPETAVVTAEIYENAVNSIKKEFTEKFDKLCKEAHVESHLDPDFYVKEIKQINKKINSAYANAPADVSRDIIDDMLTADKHRIEECKHLIEELNSYTHSIDVLARTQQQFFKNIKDFIEQHRSELRDYIFDQFKTVALTEIEERIKAKNPNAEYTPKPSKSLYDYEYNSLQNILIPLVDKNTPGKLNIHFEEIIDRFLADLSMFACKYYINSKDNLIQMQDDLQSFMDDIVSSFKDALNSWIYSCINIHMIGIIPDLKDLQNVVAKVMASYSKKLCSFTTLQPLLKDCYSMMDLNMYFDEVKNVIKIDEYMEDTAAVDNEEDDRTIESFIKQLPKNEYFAISELMNMYTDYFGEDISAVALGKKVKGYLKKDRRTVDGKRVYCYIRE